MTSAACLSVNPDAETELGVASPLNQQCRAATLQGQVGAWGLAWGLVAVTVSLSVTCPKVAARDKEAVGYPW